ncbi:MAG: site-2 protease family protein [Comamonadaceae bacterium]|nr:site-2 protease family protein [Comamonadaceae bacterium]
MLAFLRHARRPDRRSTSTATTGWRVACGVKVLRFSVGFGRVLLAPPGGADGTEFVVCALPLGGYVRMLDEREGAGRRRASCTRAFNRQPLRQRTAIVAAGPLANLLLAVLLYAAAHWIGIEEPQGRARRAGGRQRWPSAPACAPATGCARGRATASDWRDVRSMTDLRWQVTQAALRREPLQLQVERPRRPRPRARVTLDLGRARAARGRRHADARDRPRARRTASRCSARSRPAARPRGRPARGRPRARASTAQPIADAQRCASASAAGARRPGRADALAVERDGRALELDGARRASMSDGGQRRRPHRRRSSAAGRRW